MRGKEEEGEGYWANTNRVEESRRKEEENRERRNRTWR